MAPTPENAFTYLATVALRTMARATRPRPVITAEFAHMQDVALATAGTAQVKLIVRGSR